MDSFNKKTIIVVTLLLVTGLFVRMNDRSAQSMDILPGEKTLPRIIEKWEGVDLPYDARVFEGVLGADATTFRQYFHSGTGRSVQCYLAYYHSMEQSDLAHAPQVCYVGQGWEIGKSGKLGVRLSVGSEEIRVSQMHIAKGDRKELVLYWYQVGQRAYASMAAQRMQLIVNRLLGKPDANLWVRISTGIVQNDNEKALRTLSDFIAAFHPSTLALLADEGVQPFRK